MYSLLFNYQRANLAALNFSKFCVELHFSSLQRIIHTLHSSKLALLDFGVFNSLPSLEARKPSKVLYSKALKALQPLMSIKNGGGERDRTDDLLRARQALSQLSYTPIFCTLRIRGRGEGSDIHHRPASCKVFPLNVVGLGGLEPPTSRLSGVRSNQN